MGIFDGLGLAEVSSDPWAVMDGTYEFNIVECTSGPTQRGDKQGILFKFEVISEAEAGKTQTEWLEIPKPTDTSPEAMRHRMFLRQRLESIGIPASKFNEFEANDAIGITGFMTIATGKAKGGKYIKSIALNKPAEGVTEPSTPAAGNSNLFD